MPRYQAMLRGWIGSWWFWWVILGMVIRIAVAITALHPDVFALVLTPAFFAYHGVINIYAYLAHLTPATSDYAKSLGTQDVFIYPPLTYYTLGIFQLLFRPFTDAGFLPVVTKHLADTAADPRIFKFLFFAKLPYLVFDMASLYFLTNLFPERKTKMWLFFLWLFNPITIYASYMIGNFDIIPTFFTIIGTYYLAKNRTDLGLLLFGLGGAYKTYPILLALPLVFYYGESLKQYILYGLYIVGPYVLASLPFVFTAAYRSNVLFNAKDTKFLFMELPVSGADFIYIFVIGMVLICGTAAYRKVRLEQFWVYPCAVLLLFYTVTNYHPQWMVWLAPFACIVFALYRWSRLPLVIMLCCYIAVIFFFDTSLNIAIFGPIIPASQHWMSLTTLLTKHQFDPSQLRSLVRSVFSGLAILLSLKLLLPEKKQVEDPYALN